MFSKSRRLGPALLATLASLTSASAMAADPASPECAATPPARAEAARSLAPGGTLRAAINLGNTVLAVEDPVTGAPGGVSVALARELGRRLGVPVELVVYDAAGKVFAALEHGAWDVAFMAVEPERAGQIAFTAPYVFIEGTYLVRRDSPYREVADLDRPGVRIAVGRNAAYDLYLTRTLKAAQLVRAPTSAEAITQFQAERLDAAGGVRQALADAAKADPALRVLDGAYTRIEQAMGAPRGRGEAGLCYLRDFVEAMKASGFVRRALDASGQAGAVVAPARSD